MRTISSAEAQNHFGLLLDTVQREPITITRRGRPVAYLLSPQEFMALTQGTADATRDLLTAFRGSGKGGSVDRLLADRQADRLAEP